MRWYGIAYGYSWWNLALFKRVVMATCRGITNRDMVQWVKGWRLAKHGSTHHFLGFMFIWTLEHVEQADLFWWTSNSFGIIFHHADWRDRRSLVLVPAVVGSLESYVEGKGAKTRDGTGRIKYKYDIRTQNSVEYTSKHKTLWNEISKPSKINQNKRRRSCFLKSQVLPTTTSCLSLERLFVPLYHHGLLLVPPWLSRAAQIDSSVLMPSLIVESFCHKKYGKMPRCKIFHIFGCHVLYLLSGISMIIVVFAWQYVQSDEERQLI